MVERAQRDVRRDGHRTWASFFRLMARGEADRPEEPRRQGARRLLHGVSQLRPAVHLRQLQRHQARRRGLHARNGARLSGLSQPPPAAARLSLADVRIVRDPLDGPGVSHLAAHGEVLRSRRRAVPPHPPDAGAAVHSLRRGGRSLPAPGLCPARGDARRAARDVAGDGADCICRGATTATCRTWPAAASGSSSGTSICSPFYYIDYTLAQTCALQLWVRSQKDPAGTLAAYNALCPRGGEAPFQELARSAGLVSPFQPGCLRDVVEQAKVALA